MSTSNRFFAVLLILCLLVGFGAASAASADTVIDNAALIPKYVPDDQVTYINGTPDWADDLILAQFRIETATEEGTLEAAIKVLDHYAEMGVNGLMILPVSDRSNPLENGYLNFGPDTIWPRITGTTDYEKGWAKFKTFCDEAHKRNLRVIVDIITKSICTDSPTYKAHPKWFKDGATATAPTRAVCQWTNKDLSNFWSNSLIDVALKTGLDGYRCDCEPNVSGFPMYLKVRQTLAQKGHKILIVSETVSHRSDKSGNLVYDFEQWGGVTYHDRSVANWGNRLMENPNDTFLTHKNIVDAIKTKGDSALYDDGKYRLYINMLTCHDNRKVCAKGNRIYFGYQAIFAPFIPMFYIGEEWNNPQKCGGTGVLYFNEINWTMLEKPENRAFYEDLKRMIRVRRQYADVFEYFTDSVRDVNICKVESSSALQSYARYKGDTAILIVANTDETFEKKMSVTVPWNEMGMASDGRRYTLTEAVSGKEIATATREELTNFFYKLPAESVGCFVLTPAADTPTTTKTTTKTTASATTPSGTVTEEPETEVPATETEVPAETEVDTEPASEPASEPETLPATEPTDDDAPFPWVWIAVGGGAIAIVVVCLFLFKKHR